MSKPSDLFASAGIPVPPVRILTTSAVLSDCGTYRYLLTRTWDEAKTPLLFLMLNPSTADAETDDPTIRRCVGFAKERGHGGLSVINLFAFRATSPLELRDLNGDVIGPENDRYIAAQLHRQRILGGPVVAAWGAEVEKWREGMERAESVRWMIRASVSASERAMPHAVYCLGTTASGQPRHPLYLKGETPLIPYPCPTKTP